MSGLGISESSYATQTRLFRGFEREVYSSGESFLISEGESFSSMADCCNGKNPMRLNLREVAVKRSKKNRKNPEEEEYTTNSREEQLKLTVRQNIRHILLTRRICQHSMI